MKTSNQALIKDFQTGGVVTPVESAVAIQQLGDVEAQPNDKSGMIKHLGTISALLNKDAAEKQSE